MRGILICAWILIAGGDACPALADISILSSLQGESDENLYRLPDSLEQQLGRNASDRSLTAEGLLQIGLNRNAMRIQAHAAAERTIFARNTNLNNLGYDFGASLDKQGSRSSITFDAASVRRLTTYQDVRSTARSIQSLTTFSGAATRSFLGNLRAIVGSDFSRSTNTDPAISVNDYQRYGIRVGIGYYSPAGNVAAIEARIARSRGLTNRPFLLDGIPTDYRSSYTERSVEGHLLYQPSLLIQFEGRLGIARHKDESGFRQDFSGLIGQAKAQWSPRDTLQFYIEARRAFQTASGLLSNGVKVTNLTFNAVGQITKSVSLSADFKQSWRDFLVSLNQTGITPGHKERITAADAQFTYSPGGRYSLTIAVERSRRSSADQSYRYKATTVSATLAVRFGANAFQATGSAS